MDSELSLNELLHLTCLGASAQPETGGDLLLHFGGWQLYDDPPNPKLLASERGKWSLMLMCPWRLDGLTAVICDWRSVAEPGKRLDQAYLALEGLSVEAIQLSNPGFDLRIRFSSDISLIALCDSVGRSKDCWYLLRPDNSSIVATRDFRLVYEPPEA